MKSEQQWTEGPDPQERETPLQQLVAGMFAFLARRRWWILATASIISVGAAAYSLTLKNEFESFALIGLVEQKISSRYFTPDIPISPNSTLAAMRREILSSDSLLRIIDDLDLYREARSSLTPQGLVDRLYMAITIEPQGVHGNEFDAFRIAFTADDRDLAQRVTGRLTALFIEQNLAQRGDQIETTQRYIDERVDMAKRKLDEQERELRDFKSQYGSQMLDQQFVSMQTAALQRADLVTVANDESRVRQQQDSIRSRARELVGRARTDREDLLRTLTTRHERVIEAGRKVSILEEFLEQMSAAGTNRTLVAPVEGGSELTAIANEWNVTVTELENLARKGDELRAEINRANARLSQAPVREQQLSEIQRDYDLLKADYLEAKNQQMDYNSSAAAEQRQEAGTFRVLNPPSLPLAPVRLVGLQTSLMGLVAGIMLGCCAGFLAEQRDRSLHSEDELRGSFPSVPLILSIPPLPTPVETKLGARRRRLEWAGGLVLLIAMFGAQLHVYLNS